MIGYKIFNEDWTCLGVQYTVGKTTRHIGPICPGQIGLHFCAEAVNCLKYYKLSPKHKYAEVRPESGARVKNCIDKIVTSALVVIREIPYDEFCKLVTCTQNTHHGVRVETQYVGDVRVEIQYVRDVRHGTCKMWRRNGQISEEINYAMGKCEGVCKSWYANGQLKVESNYCDNKLHGEYREWYETGQMYRTMNYVHGKLNGADSIWWPNGQMQIQTLFKDGNYHGLHISWYKNGKMSTSIGYHTGQYDGPYKTWRVNGTPIVAANYTMGKLIGEYLKYHTTGTLSEHYNYKRGARVGHYELRYKNEQVKESGYYGSTKIVHKRWYGNGMIKEEMSWQNGAIVTTKYRISGHPYLEIYEKGSKVIRHRWNVHGVLVTE